MTSQTKFQAIRGTRDLLPPETALWNRVEQAAHEVFGTYGYGEIRLPIFESTELFARSIGEDTDVVGKEMYTFYDIPGLDDAQKETLKKEMVKKALDLGLGVELKDFESTFGELSSLATRHSPLATSISLRPEATASVCRAYIEHNLQQLPQPVKLYYMGPMFRRERPQKGRYRQFYQIGAEVLGGSDAPAIDAELIEMLMTFFDKIGLQGTTLYINSIGHSADNCRRAYVAKLKSELEKVKDKLGPDSQRRIGTNPLRVLDSKLDQEQPIIEKLPHIADHLCPDCAANYAAVKHELELRGVIYRENWRLVRGLDYYMRTTFEITAQGLGSQNAVCGGGRYDGLVELLGGPPTKGIGFAIGEDRLILSLQESVQPQSPATSHQSLFVYIAWMGLHAYAAAIRAAKDLRNAGIRVELPPIQQKFGKALGQADKLGAQYALILGDDEVSEGLWTLKTLSTGEQTKLTEPDLLQFLRTQKPA
jgi:histidyl-tRNA synthetase